MQSAKGSAVRSRQLIHSSVHAKFTKRLASQPVGMTSQLSACAMLTGSTCDATIMNVSVPGLSLHFLIAPWVDSSAGDFQFAAIRPDIQVRPPNTNKETNGIL